MTLCASCLALLADEAHNRMLQSIQAGDRFVCVCNVPLLHRVARVRDQ